MVLLSLLLEDRNAMLEIRKVDVGNHAPLKATEKARLEADNFRWRPIAGENDLTAGFVECVEGVEEFFLRRLFSFEKMNVVDEKKIRLAVPLTKSMSGAIAHRTDELIHELLG